MRTTLDIDDTVLHAAKALARDEKTSVGSVISRLARRGLAPAPVGASGSKGFPVFDAPPDASPITLDVVNAHRDEE